MLTAILTTYRRPQTFAAQLAAVRGQSVSPNAIWAWANEPTAEIASLLAAANLDRVVTCGDNAKFHGRFALALLARTEYVAIFDDDSLPGPKWFENCLKTMSQTPGILGTAGVVLGGPGYIDRVMHGWQRPSDETVEVDLVCQAWFLGTEWLKYLFFSPAILGTNGEDIELSARAWRHAGIRSLCPAHPAGDQSLWGSTRGMELGTDKISASFRAGHLGERETIVAAELAAGWLPLFAREEAGSRQQAGAAGSRQQAVGSGRQAPATQQDDLAYSSLATRHTPHATHPKLSECFPISGWATDYRYLLDDCGELTGESRSVLRAAAWPVRGAGKNLPAHPADDTSPFSEENGDARMAYDRMDLGLSLNYMRDPLAFLRRARKQLAPGGTVSASFLDAQHPSVVNEIVSGQPPYSSHPSPPLRIFTEREIEKLLYRAGFEHVPPSTGDDATESPDRPLVRSISFIPCSSSPASASSFILPPSSFFTSIVIVTHNEVAYSRACLESIRFLTDEPYELIVVDNGSTDGTVDYLRGAPDVRLIANPENRGFPAAANQGIRAARGQHILLLNNDVLVTTGWLGRMLAALRGPDAGIGYDVVGPCSNNVSGPQQIDVAYDDLAQLDGFAWEWAKAHAGEREETDRLVGFCLLVRREVFDRVGLLDERFGIGNFEDDDFCLRAVAAGYRLAIVRDAFIHHFGHRSFLAAGVDLHSLLANNRRLFDEKWKLKTGTGSDPLDEESVNSRGREVPVPFFQQPGAPPRPSNASPASPLATRHPPHATPERHSPPVTLLSLAMIVRDNASTIRACLQSIRPWVDEMIVVDTGSKDDTPAICRELGAEVYHFPWPDSFAVARNESLRHARGEWIFWMDSDDVIDADNGRKLRELAIQLSHGPTLDAASADAAGVMGYVVQVQCPSTGKDGFREMTVVDHVKLIRNLPELRFEGRIHEQIIPAIRRAGGEVGWTDLFVVHTGSDETPEGKERKLQRDLRLLELELHEHPQSSFAHFNLGMTYEVAGRNDEAVAALKRSLDLSDPSESQVRKAYSLLVGCLSKLGRHDAAWEACQQGAKLFPQDTELLFRQGQLAHHFGRYAEAERAYHAVLAGDDPRHFTSIDHGIMGYKTHHNLALVYADQGDLAKTEGQWRLVTGEAPDYLDGWRGLGEALMRQQKYDELSRLADELVERPLLRGLGLAWRAQPLRVGGDREQAGRLLQAAVDELPDDTDIVQACCQLLFEAGDLEECERALTHLLRLVPDNPGAHHNLGTLYLRMERHADAADVLRRSVELAPRNAAAHVHFGHALARLGQTTEAIRAWAEALKIEPANRHAFDALAHWSRAENNPPEPAGNGNGRPISAPGELNGAMAPLVLPPLAGADSAPVPQP